MAETNCAVVARLKEAFLKRIAEELSAFKISILGEEKEIIFSEAYRIDSFITLYETLVASIDEIQITVMLALVNQTGKILESLFTDYSNLYGDQYSNMHDYIKNMEV